MPDFPIPEAGMPETGPDAGLLARSRTAWELGDWVALAALADQPLEGARDRAKLALLAAVGLAQLGQLEPARIWAERAREWGCPASLMARVLIGGVLNSLGRVASLCDDTARAREYFQTSVAVVDPRFDAALIGQARGQLEQMRLGLRVQADSALSGDAPKVEGAQATGAADYRDSPHFSMPSLNRLQSQLSKTIGAPCLLETKSLPRAGLHFIQRTLERVLGDKYSFCEWYQEPGCCRKMPCAMTPHLLAGKETAPGLLRVTKSHDFALNDPAYRLSAGLERLILVRDPVFSLTSWWMLSELQRHQDFLKAHDISMLRINFRHEPKVVRAAMDIMDTHYRDPAPNALPAWLKKQAAYMAGFADKWGAETAQASDKRTRLVHYDAIPVYLSDLVARKLADLPDGDEKQMRQSLLAVQLEGFRPRKSPFSSASSRALGFVYQNQKAFRETAMEILERDRYGIFKGGVR